MQKLIAILCALTICPILSLPVWGAIPESEELVAEAAVLMDAETGQVLFEKNMAEKMYPASITKIMTALLVLEHLESHQVLTASPEAVDIPYWGASAYIKAGENLTVDEAMYAMMLRSANDAANILAEEVGETLSGFARLMNQRAEELGATGTHFSNAHGLPTRSHYTTAYDMALITRQALQTQGFLTYFGAESYSMNPTNLEGERIFTNTHSMIPHYSYRHNDEVIGGKTGYTAQAGYTLVTVAERDGRTLICVVLKSSGQYADTLSLLDFGFEEFSPHTIPLEGDPIEVALMQGGREAGIVYLHHQNAATLLLHNSVEPEDIAVEYVYPELLEGDVKIEGGVFLTVEGAYAQGLPETLYTLPFQVEVALHPIPVVEEVEFPTEEPEPSQPMALLLAAPLILAATILATMLHRHNQKPY